jgi:predicted nucleic acid-binding protein
VKNGITFDTGALIALERRGQRARQVLERATEQKVRITVPAAVITEWWRGRSDIRERILAGVRIEPLSEDLAKVAGEALAAVRGATSVDAIVMASAAQRGDVVYTADVSDLARLASYFRAIRVLGISCYPP